MDGLPIMASVEEGSSADIVRSAFLAAGMVVVGFLMIKYARPLASPWFYPPGPGREFQVWLGRLFGLIILGLGVYFLGALLFTLLFGGS